MQRFHFPKIIAEIRTRWKVIWPLYVLDQLLFHNSSGIHLISRDTIPNKEPGNVSGLNFSLLSALLILQDIFHLCEFPFCSHSSHLVKLNVKGTRVRQCVFALVSGLFQRRYGVLKAAAVCKHARPPWLCVRTPHVRAYKFMLGPFKTCHAKHKGHGAAASHSSPRWAASE